MSLRGIEMTRMCMKALDYNIWHSSIGLQTIIRHYIQRVYSRCSSIWCRHVKYDVRSATLLEPSSGPQSLPISTRLSLSNLYWLKIKQRIDYYNSFSHIQSPHYHSTFVSI